MITQWRLDTDLITRTPPQSGAIRGREQEQEAIADLVRKARRGRSGMLLIEGEPGMGKSLLLSEAARIAEKEHVHVAAARGDEVTRSTPLGALLDLPGESPVPAAGDVIPDGMATRPARLAEVVRDRLEKLAGDHPLLVSLDDLQWVDYATMQALSVLPGLLASSPVVWLLARRVPDKTRDGDLLFSLLESRGVSRLSLGPLGNDAVGDMITDAIGAAPGPGLLAMASGANGNPFLLSEFMAGLVEENAVVIRDGQAVARTRQVPRRVHAAVRHMLRGITPKTRQLLETTAVLGLSFGLRDAAAMLGSRPAALLPSVEEAMAARILVVTKDSLAFRQALVWQAVSESLPRPVSQALHRQFGEILMARGGSAVSAAAHLLSGTDAGDVAALAQLDRAASEVLPASPEVAADLATCALELTRPWDPRKLARTTAAAGALTAAGQLDRATELARSALAVPMPATTSAGLRCALSSALLMSGQAAEALNEALHVLAEPRIPGALRGDAKVVLLQALAGTRDYRRAGELAAATIAAPEEERPEMVVTALVLLAGIMWDAGRLDEALAMSANAVRMTAGQPTGAWRVHPHLFLASRLVDLRRFDEARVVMGSSSGHFDALAPIQWSATAPTLRARMALAAGKLDDAARHAEAALRLASVPAACSHGSMARAVLATVAIRRGDLKTAAGHLHGSRARRAKSVTPLAGAWDSLIAAQVKEGFEGPRAALEMITAAYDEIGTHRFPLMCDPTCAAWLVRTAVAAGDRDRARAVAAAAADIAAWNPELTVARVCAAHACGIADGDPGRVELAAAQHPDRWARASAAEDLAGLELGARSRRASVTRLDQALEDYQAVGATRDVARVRRRLRRLGVRRGHWAAVSRPVSGWNSLTATERSACELISQGLTNQQAADQMFISVHTVAFHLRQVFRKLGISSRVELTRMAVEQAQAAPGSEPSPAGAPAADTGGRC
jgi:DNA-binding CsgD family transcriptional regulator